MDDLLKALGGRPLPESERYRESIRQISSGEAFTFSRKMEVDNSALVMELQAAPRTPENLAILQILSTALEPLAYNELRTNQQLGYIVNAGVTNTEDTLGLVFMIQSGVYGPAELEQRARAFLQKFLEQLKGLPEERFEALRQAVLNGKFDKPDSPSGEASRLFSLAFERNANFNQNSEDLLALESLRPEAMAQVQEWFAPEQQRRLSLRMIGKPHQDGPVEGTLISEVDTFRSAFPCPRWCQP